MKLEKIESDIKQRKIQLARCLSSLKFFNSLPVSEDNRSTQALVEYEAFFLHDQLERYNNIYSIVRDEEKESVTDEALF